METPSRLKSEQVLRINESTEWQKIAVPTGLEPAFPGATLEIFSNPPVNRGVLTLAAGTNWTPLDFKAVLEWPSLRHKWDPAFDRAEILEMVDDFSLLAYARTKSFWPIYPRDLYLQFSGLPLSQGSVAVDAWQKGYMLLTWSVEDSKNCPESSDSFVRAFLHYASFIVVPLPDGGLTVTYLVHSDPKGFLPLSLVRRMSQMVPKCLSSILAALENGGAPPTFLSNSWKPLKQGHSIQCDAYPIRRVVFDSTSNAISILYLWKLDSPIECCSTIRFHMGWLSGLGRKGINLSLVRISGDSATPCKARASVSLKNQEIIVVLTVDIHGRADLEMTIAPFECEQFQVSFEGRKIPFDVPPLPLPSPRPHRLDNSRPAKDALVINDAMSAFLLFEEALRRPITDWNLLAADAGLSSLQIAQPPHPTGLVKGHYVIPPSEEFSAEEVVLLLASVIDSIYARQAWDDIFDHGRSLYFPALESTESELPGNFRLEGVRVAYSSTKPLWPTSARDLVTVISRSHNEQSVRLIASSLGKEALDFLGISGCEKGFVRANLVLAAWDLTILRNSENQKSIQVTYIAKSDPCGSIPHLVLRQLVTKFPLSIRNVIRHWNEVGGMPFVLSSDANWFQQAGPKSVCFLFGSFIRPGSRSSLFIDIGLDVRWLNVDTCSIYVSTLHMSQLQFEVDWPHEHILRLKISASFMHDAKPEITIERKREKSSASSALDPAIYANLTRLAIKVPSEKPVSLACNSSQESFNRYRPDVLGTLGTMCDAFQFVSDTHSTLDGWRDISDSALGLASDMTLSYHSTLRFSTYVSNRILKASLMLPVEPEEALLQTPVYPGGLSRWLAETSTVLSEKGVVWSEECPALGTWTGSFSSMTSSIVPFPTKMRLSCSVFLKRVSVAGMMKIFLLFKSNERSKLRWPLLALVFDPVLHKAPSNFSGAFLIRPWTRVSLYIVDSDDYFLMSNNPQTCVRLLLNMQLLAMSRKKCPFLSYVPHSSPSEIEIKPELQLVRVSSTSIKTVKFSFCILKQPPSFPKILGVLYLWDSKGIDISIPRGFVPDSVKIDVDSVKFVIDDSWREMRAVTIWYLDNCDSLPVDFDMCFRYSNLPGMTINGIQLKEKSVISSATSNDLSTLNLRIVYITALFCFLLGFFVTLWKDGG